jgi:hypothetical protein
MTGTTGTTHRDSVSRPHRDTGTGQSIYRTVPVPTILDRLVACFISGELSRHPRVFARFLHGLDVA